MEMAKAVHLVGGLLIENLQRRTAGGALKIPEVMLRDPDLYALAVNEFTDIVANYGGKFESPAGFQTQVVDHVTRYLEARGYLA